MEKFICMKKSFWVQEDLQSSYKAMLATVLRVFRPIHVKILCTCLSQQTLDAVNFQCKKT
jgi:hypothetical protein